MGRVLGAIAVSAGRPAYFDKVVAVSTFLKWPRIEASIRMRIRPSVRTFLSKLDYVPASCVKKETGYAVTQNAELY